FYRVGGHVPLKVDVRIIAATHQNLEQLVTERRFREDLFHRLNVIRVHVPSLRERREDIPVLLRHFLTTAASELQVTPKKTTKSVEEYLQRLNWPGNVRQLQNVARWLTVMASGNEILMEDLPEDLKNTTEEPEGNHWENELQRWVDSALHRGEKDLLSQIVPTFEKILIESALRKTGNRRQDAAKLLGWGRNTLTRKIKELDID
ncbi:MAG TPA: nitrogen regulation protein NR(I), partial [Gammaproteobacteria bacterium]|nr:nitrogen regulation protein NR(I) [Gammaproteobacteria bacterium]